MHIDIMISAKMTKDKWINGDEMTDFYTAGTWKPVYTWTLEYRVHR